MFEMGVRETPPPLPGPCSTPNPTDQHPEGLHFSFPSRWMADPKHPPLLLVVVPQTQNLCPLDVVPDRT